MSAVATTMSSATTVATTSAVTAATAMTDRCMRVTGMTDRCMRVTGMNDRRMRMTAVTAAGMSAMPMVPAIAAAPADAGREVFAAPVPARAVPAVVVPAVIVTEPDELRALDDIQAIGRIANGSGCGHRRGARLHDRCARKEYRCGSNDSSKFAHDDTSQCMD